MLHSKRSFSRLTAFLVAGLTSIVSGFTGCDEKIDVNPLPAEPDPVASQTTPNTPPTPRDTSTPRTAPDRVFITAQDALQLHQEGATFLDARTERQFSSGHIQGAHSAPWKRFVDGTLSGLLSTDLGRLQDAMRSMNVRKDAPVVVYGSWSNEWGEEGRLFWTLEYLGHPNVHILAGGISAWQQTSPSLVTRDATPTPTPSQFTVRVQEHTRATADEVREALQTPSKVLILDTREGHEFRGSTPYGSKRGGHIPNARHFWWKDVFETQGRLKPRSSLRQLFTSLGAQDDTIIVAYCTGGIRSGFMYAILRWLGFSNPQNYDGSWWEWSSQDSLPVDDGT